MPIRGHGWVMSTAHDGCAPGAQLPTMHKVHGWLLCLPKFRAPMPMDNHQQCKALHGHPSICAWMVGMCLWHLSPRITDSGTMLAHQILVCSPCHAPWLGHTKMQAFHASHGFVPFGWHVMHEHSSWAITCCPRATQNASIPCFAWVGWAGALVMARP